MANDIVAKLRDLGDRAAFDPHMHHKAADHIEYLQRRLVSARNYEENLRRALAKTRHQRNELRKQINGGHIDLWANHPSGMVDGAGVDCAVSDDDLGGNP